MKKLSYLLSLGVLAALLVTVGCSKDEGTDLTIEQQQLAAITGTWVADADSDVTKDDIDAPGDWTGFSITFNNSGSVSVNVPAAASSEVQIFAVTNFTTSGTSATNFTANFGTDNADIAISGDVLTLSFTLAEEGKLGGRTESVAGAWSFTLDKQ